MRNSLTRASKCQCSVWLLHVKACRIGGEKSLFPYCQKIKQSRRDCRYLDAFTGKRQEQSPCSPVTDFSLYNTWVEFWAVTKSWGGVWNTWYLVVFCSCWSTHRLEKFCRSNRQKNPSTRGRELLHIISWHFEVTCSWIADNQNPGRYPQEGQSRSAICESSSPSTGRNLLVCGAHLFPHTSDTLLSLQWCLTVL